MIRNTAFRFVLRSRHGDDAGGMRGVALAAITKTTLRIPMRDGIELGADLYRPRTPSRGTVLARGPYGRPAYLARTMAIDWAKAGYTALLVSSRGTADSAGAFDPMRGETPDGKDVVAWMRQQDWYTGSFATVGGSYLGHTQWAILDDPEPDHVAAIVSIGPHDFAEHAWGTGSFNLDLYGWTEQMALMSSGRGILRMLIGMATSAKRLRPLMLAEPSADAAIEYFGKRAPWLAERLRNPDIDDAYWAPMRHGRALGQAQLPVLILGGLQDLFQRQSVHQFAMLAARGVTTGLTLGPWTHIDRSREHREALHRETLAWLDHHLAGDGPAPRRHRVRVYDTGTHAWHESQDWPVAVTTRTLRLGGDGALDEAAAPGERSFVYDPADPTPTIGGNVITREGGYVDDGALARRGDVLVYETAPLAEDAALGGAPVVVLEHGAEHPDADVFVRLSDVDERGRSRNVTEGFVRRLGDAADGRVELALLDSAHTFGAGHRIRLVVAGGSFPQFARSSGTGGNPLTATEFRRNRHTVAAGELRLPLR